MESNLVAAAIRSAPLFAALPARCHPPLELAADVVEFEPGELVQSPGRAVRAVSVVASGMLRVDHHGQEQQSRAVRILGPGDHVGLVAYLLGSPPPTSVVAIDRVTVAEVPFDALRAVLVDCPEFVASMLTTLATGLIECEHRLVSLATGDVRSRVISFLLSLPISSSGADGRRVAFVVPHSDIASLLGTTPETLSRRLTELVDDGLVERVAPGEFLLDEDGLVASLRRA